MKKPILPTPLADFDFAKPEPLRRQDKEHLQYYRAFFETDNTTQHLGCLRLANFDIACYWFKQVSAKQTVLILHGYNDHVGLYRHCIKALLTAGFNVLAIDLPGHGLSSGEQAAIQSFVDYRKVVHAFLAQLPQDIAQSLLLVGQSTGAAIATDYLLYHPQHPFQKVVLLGPLVRPIQWLFISLQLLIAGALVHRIKRVFRQNCHNTQFLRFIKYDDPLQTRYVKVSWVKALRDWHQLLSAASPSCTPCLIIQGEADTVVAWRYNLKQLQKKLTKIKVQLLPQAKHHLVNEQEKLRQQVFAALIVFLKAK